MSFSKIYSTGFSSLKSFIIEIETDISKKGLPSFKIVGLADKAVEESRERVLTALKNIGYPEFKRWKIVTSFSPADLKKEGPIFDLGIAVSLLMSGEEIDFLNEGKIFLGELSLDGRVKKIKGVLPMIREAKKRNFTSIYLPEKNALEASYVEGVKIFPVKNLKELLEHLNQEKKEKKDIKKIIFPYKKNENEKEEEKSFSSEVDFEDIKGNEFSKRAILIAASGGHNLSMYGRAGVGKTMMARAMCGILPELSNEEALEVSEIYSVSGLLEKNIIKTPPFFAPHHTSSYVSIIGGGADLKPGAVTLAHRGILFMDEFPEFDRRVLESLREPLEDGFVNISRAKGSVCFPANFILVTAFNPPSEVSRGQYIKPSEIAKFQKKISGPIMDRIDLWCEVEKVSEEKLRENKKGENSKNIKEKVKKARKIQEKRFGKTGKTNASAKPKEIQENFFITEKSYELLDEASKKMDFSSRVYHKILKIARTLADLEEKKNVEEKHILEALQFRPKEII